MKSQELYVRNFIQIGEQAEVEFEALPARQQKEIARKLNEKAMLAAGFQRTAREKTQ